MFLRYGILADAITDSAAGKKNIIGTLTVINAVKYPCQHHSIALVLRVEGSRTEEGEHVLEIAFVDADYKPVGPTVKGQFVFKAEDVPEGMPFAIETAFTINGLPLEKPGNYEFTVKIDGRHIGSVPLLAALVSPQAH